jgi:uncharacterized coiled-coil protein SlyX
VEPERRARKEKPKAERPVRKRPTRLELLEAEIARREGAVADLERALAEDWTDVEKLAAHRRARDELHALLAEWEELFEAAQA